MCREEVVNLQRGTNYRSDGRLSVIFMSRRLAHLTMSELKRAAMTFSVKETTDHRPAAGRTRRPSTTPSEDPVAP